MYANSCRFGSGAAKVTKGWNGTWVVETTNGTFIKANSVVIASGGFTGGKSPPFEKDVPSDITQIHSWQYKNPSQVFDVRTHTRAHVLPKCYPTTFLSFYLPH